MSYFYGDLWIEKKIRYVFVLKKFFVRREKRSRLISTKLQHMIINLMELKFALLSTIITLVGKSPSFPFKLLLLLYFMCCQWQCRVCLISSKIDFFLCFTSFWLNLFDIQKNSRQLNFFYHLCLFLLQYWLILIR